MLNILAISLWWFIFYDGILYIKVKTNRKHLSSAGYKMFPFWFWFYHKRKKGKKLQKTFSEHNYSSCTNPYSKGQMWPCMVTNHVNWGSGDLKTVCRLKMIWSHGNTVPNISTHTTAWWVLEISSVQKISVTAMIINHCYKFCRRCSD